jgi:hypothetical protein
MDPVDRCRWLTKMIRHGQGSQNDHRVGLFIAVAVVMATAVVKIFEWRQEALYGPYARRDRGKQNSQAID